MDHGDYDKYGICHSLRSPLAASVDMFAGRQVNELGDGAVSLTAVGISALTAVGLSGSLDQRRGLARGNRTLQTTQRRLQRAELLGRAFSLEI